MKKLLITLVTLTLFISSCKKEDQIESSSQKELTVETIGLGNRYGGGIIFYLDSSKAHGLIAADEDQATQVKWNEGTVTFNGAVGQVIGTGKPNTLKLCPQNSTNLNVAFACDTLILNGFDDWFMPSIDELEILYNRRNLVGGFDYDAEYWSSSEVSQNNAYMYSFYIGNLKFVDWKWKLANIRAIRSF